MDEDMRRYRTCLRKKVFTHQESEDVVRKMRKNSVGAYKGKKRKTAQTVVAYRCSYCGHYHVGRDRFGGKYDEAYKFRKQGK